MSRHPQHRLPIISLLLLVLMVRALVPAGFMPGSGGAAQLVLCPDGMLMPSNADAADPASPAHSHTDHCPFGSAPFAAPIADLPVLPVLAAAISIAGFEPTTSVPRVRAAYAHQARAPPA